MTLTTKNFENLNPKRFKNLTPHPLSFYHQDQVTWSDTKKAFFLKNANDFPILTLPISGHTLRLVVETDTIGEHSGIPIVHRAIARPRLNLDSSCVNIVSKLVALAYNEEALYYPDGMVKDTYGKVIGCVSLGIL